MTRTSSSNQPLHRTARPAERIPRCDCSESLTNLQALPKVSRLDSINWRRAIGVVESRPLCGPGQPAVVLHGKEAKKYEAQSRPRWRCAIASRIRAAPTTRSLSPLCRRRLRSHVITPPRLGDLQSIHGHMMLHVWIHLLREKDKGTIDGQICCTSRHGTNTVRLSTTRHGTIARRPIVPVSALAC